MQGAIVCNSIKANTEKKAHYMIKYIIVEKLLL